ncbi:hypothetical protein [Catenovulum maritimum]|uniref:Uncharacterized protein n=1 Tax=Catenovulum maritimum TaxID=1513271 RepID=A0A0J8GXV7_9ALTE|nr:hypothetical protein [Catenovulum maritimum]KMT66059.1 hypothetical protein XM47_06330 [Catenovulum maritimum]
MFRLCLLFSLLTLPSTILFAANASSQFTSHFSISELKNDNLTNSIAQSDKLADSANTLAFSFDYRREFKLGQMFGGGLSLENINYQSLDMYDQTSSNLYLVYGWQNSFGYLAPYYFIKASYQINNHRIDAMSGNTQTITWVMNKRFTDEIHTQLGFGYLDRSANKTWFNNSEINLFLNADYNFSINTLAYAGLEFKKGKIVSAINHDSAEQNSLYLSQAAQYAQNKWHAHELSEMSGNAWYQYKLSATTAVFNLGLLTKITDKINLDISASYAKSNAKGSLSYSSTILSSKLSINF